MPVRSAAHFFATIVAATIVTGTVSSSAHSADASAWDGDTRAGIRLIGGAQVTEAGSTLLRAGAEIRLSPGWKTYWRYPGDSGVPPNFDFGKSENVKSVTVQWPAPQRIVDSEGITIGYKTGVVFPLNVVPLDPNKPVMLRMKLDYAICEKLCVPAQGQAELSIKAGGTLASAIAAAEKAVPRARELGADSPLAVKKVTREDGGKLPRILVDVAAPAGAKIDLFAEGPSQDWALPVPEMVEGAPAGLQRFAFALDGLPPGANPKGAELKLTVVAGSEAIETTFRLD
ncbi:MAG: protein-disulfide reductase DsbD domain-containing protein [Pseudorhodoplanes sp.]